MDLTALDLRSNILMIDDFLHEDGVFEIPQPDSVQAVSQVVEALLMRVPLPAIYVQTFYKPSLRHVPIWGDQILAAIWHFAVSRIKLEGLKCFPEFNDKTFAELDGYVQRRFREQYLQVHYIYCKDDILNSYLCNKIVLFTK